MKLLRFKKLLENIEGVTVDWKVKFPEKFSSANKEDRRKAQGELIYDMYALSNTPGDQTRYLVYGVHDITKQNFRKVVGVSEIPFDESNVRQWSSSYLDRPLDFEMCTLDYDGLTVVIFDIVPDREGPRVSVENVGPLTKGVVVYRDGSRNEIADGPKLRELFTGGPKAGITFGRKNGSAHGSQYVISEQIELALADSITQNKTKIELRLANVSKKRHEASNRPRQIQTISSFQAKVSVEDIVKIQRAIRITGLNATREEFNPVSVFRDYSPNTAYFGQDAEWYNATYELLWDCEAFLNDQDFIESWTSAYPICIRVANTGGIALEGLQLEVRVKNGFFKANLEGFVVQKGNIVKEDSRRFETHTNNVIARLPILAAGAAEVFFGASLQLTQEEMLLECSVSAKPLTQPVFSTLHVSR